MAVQIQQAVAVPIISRKTHPLIQCITEDKSPEFQNLIKDSDINVLYPSEEWNDDVTPLTAAVRCSNEEICSYLIEQLADPNMLSTNGIGPLHYGARTNGVPLSIVKRVLAAGAYPDGPELQILPPLQYAVEHDREDIVKALIEAGASPELICGVNSALTKKTGNIINQLSLQNQEFEKIKIFFSFSLFVPNHDQGIIFKKYRKHFLIEHPFVHVMFFETYYCVKGANAKKYQKSTIKWLNAAKTTGIYSFRQYIDGFFKRFSRMPQKHALTALKCLNGILCAIQQISSQVKSDLASVLMSILQDKNISKHENLIQEILIAAEHLQLNKPTNSPPHRMIKEDPLLLINQMFSSESVEDSTVKTQLSALLSTEPPGIHDVDNCYKYAVHSQKKKKVMLSQDSEHQNEKQSFPSPTIPRRWNQISIRWRPKLERLANIKASKTYRLGNFTLVLSDEFKIAEGSGGTEVFLGLRDDGKEVAVKRMTKSKGQYLKNEETFLRLPELESPYIVQYIDIKEDDNFGYLILQLCEYTLEEYIQARLSTDSSERTVVLKNLVREVLGSLKVLHSQNTKVLHRDIKPQNVLIDITGKAKLADFGISRQLHINQTTLHTSNAGTKCWKAKEIIDKKGNGGYKRSSDIQVSFIRILKYSSSFMNMLISSDGNIATCVKVAGMLVYYILSGGHHPFGEDPFCEGNIVKGKHSLLHLVDDVAKDLVEWMISDNPKERPTVEQALAHPFFWTDDRRVEYLRYLGKQTEVANYRNVAEELREDIEEYTKGKTFTEWKSKFPPELVQKLESKKKAYPETTLALLRFIRNLHEHHSEDAENIDPMVLFPDLFGSVYMFAKKRGWNSRRSLKKFFSSDLQILID